MHGCERQVPSRVADVREVAEQLAHFGLGPSGVRTLDVAVVDHGHRRVERPADVVRLGIDREFEVEERLCAGHGTVAAPTAAARDAALGSSSCPPSKASVATSSETVKPTPALAPAPPTAPQPAVGHSGPRDSQVTSSAMPTTPSGLPAT